MTGMLQLMAILSSALSYQLPPGKRPADPKNAVDAQPMPKAPSDSARLWLRPLFREDSDRQCGTSFARHVPGFGSIKATFGCVKSKRETTPWL